MITFQYHDDYDFSETDLHENCQFHYSFHLLMKKLCLHHRFSVSLIHLDRDAGC